MSGNANPVEAFVIDGSDVAKADWRSFAKSRLRMRFASASEAQAADLMGQLAGIDIAGVLYNISTTDTTTADDDGLTCIRDANGLAFLRVFPSVFGSRAQVRAATTANITIATALNNGDTLDGVTLATGDLVLVKDQTNAAENGIYVVGMTPARSSDFDAYNDYAGALVAVTSGTTNEGTLWFCSANNGGTLGTTDIDFTQIAVPVGVPTTRTISTAGLATGGGDLTADRTITVPIATTIEAEAALSNVVAMTPNRVGEYVTSQKGIANGLATLNATAKLTTAQIPDALTAGLDYQGVWNASTNSPALASGTGTAGQYYKVSVAGTTALDGESSWSVGDWAIFNGTAWERAPAYETGVLASVFVPAGSAAAPTIAIGQATTGFAQLFDNTVSVISNQNTADPENHGYPLFTQRGSLLLGSRSTSGDNRYPNQSALEVVIQDNAEGAAVPVTIWQNGPDSAAVEPVVMGRGRADSIEGAEVAVLAGDSVWTIQGQVTDGLGTANVAIGNFGMRVQSGTTPIAGNVLGYAGNCFLALAPGDGSSSIRTVMEWQSDGDVNAVVGSIRMNNAEVINQSRQVITTGIKNTRAAIADDAIYTYDVSGSATAIVAFNTTGTPGALFPAGIIAVRVSTNSTVVSLGLNAGAEVEFKSGGGTITDFTTCTDGKLTISAASDGKLYVCNRLGASKTFAWSTLLYNA